MFIYTAVYKYCYKNNNNGNRAIPPGQLPPWTIAPLDNFHQVQLPSDNCTPDSSDLGKLSPDNCSRIISSYDNWNPGQITPGHLPLRTIPIMVIAFRRLCRLKKFYCFSFGLCHNKILYKHKHAFFQNIRQVPLKDN